MSRIRGLLAVFALSLATIFLFDLVAYFTVPDRLTRFAVSYRKPQVLEGRQGHPALARSDTRGYYQADAETGFEIRPGARAMHEFGEEPNEIFANSLGCFDRNEASAFRGGVPYYYFAGDSFTWGFADYDSKFATVWEKATGKLAAKCGIAHSGQAHQLEKLKRFAAAVGRMPHTVFVGFYVNDPGNDAAFPHTTVLEGFTVDTVYLRDGELVRPDEAQVRKVVTDSLRELERPLTPAERAKAAVWVYSLSANVANHARLALTGALEAPAPPAARAGPAVAGAAQPLRPTSRFGDNLYYWYDAHTIATGYATDPKTEANRAAIRRWAEHARANGYRLVFLLFPPSDGYDNVELFAQVRAFLDGNRVESMDFTPAFRAAGYKREQLYWKTNDHWNAGGNRIVGRLLAGRYP